MKLLETRVYRGPNLYGYRPVIRLTVDLEELEQFPSTKIPGFVDRLLADLRKPGETDYKLPQGGLFPYVACPHYLAELIGWLGFSLVFRHVGALMLTFVMVMYLAGRSHATLAWYRERLGERVPAHWKRLVPYVF